MQFTFPPSFEVIGEIKAVDKREPTEQRRTPAMKLFIQYGPRRAGDGRREVNFLNGISVRVPHFVHQRIGDKLVQGAIVHIKGHLQGVYKAALGTVDIEAVAERVVVPRREHAPGEDASAEAAAEEMTSGAESDDSQADE